MQNSPPHSRSGFLTWSWLRSSQATSLFQARASWDEGEVGRISQCRGIQLQAGAAVPKLIFLPIFSRPCLLLCREVWGRIFIHFSFTWWSSCHKRLPAPRAMHSLFALKLGFVLPFFQQELATLWLLGTPPRPNLTSDWIGIWQEHYANNIQVSR